jgi:RNA polymerase sigma-70 factor (ECF subfamily)
LLLGLFVESPEVEMTGLEEHTERERGLIAAAQGGNREAFDGLLRSYYAGVYGTLFRLVGNPEDAEDLAQETFVKAWAALRFYRGEAPFRAWVMRIGVHLAHDYFRKRGRGAAVVGLENIAMEPRDQREGPREQARHKEAQRLVAEALEGLPAHLRVALVLRVMEGRGYDEVAEATGVRPGTVRTQVMRARKMLERMLRPLLEGRN